MIRELKKSIYKFREQKKFKKFYGQYIKAGDLCFDVGANVGNRTAVFSALKAQVVSVEPVEESLSILKEKFDKKENVTILPIALGSTSGKKEMYISNYSEVCTMSKLFIEK